MKTENRLLGAGVHSLLIPDERFKTSQLTVALLMPLNKETVEQYALLPRLLIRGCAAYPDFTALHRRLNQLYGAAVTGDVARVGETQVLVLTAECTSDRYAMSGEQLTAACAELLSEMLFRPALADGVFRAEDVETERRCLAEEVRAEINEKRWYARRQAERLLCPDEAYGVGRYGDAAVIESLTPEVVTAAWQRVLREASIQLILQSDRALPEVEETLCRGFVAVSGRKPVVCHTDTVTRLPEFRRQVERMEVGQSKLVLGFRAGCAEPETGVNATRLMNALLGGTATSLLFKNVREKLSLCYYCSSVYDRMKGVLLVQSGVDEQNAERAETEILAQLEAIRRGDFTDEELEAARRSIVQSFEAVNDSQSARSAWYVSQAALEQPTTPEKTREEIEAVTREEVIAAAKRVRYECAYLLAQKGGTADE
ncbi:MAG: insulinase family protein [Clostridia bacterium]|nr:insulinase family protein [Clostridia bacterium]